jgi:ABC-type phosphate transport system substrate-binding protein
MARIQARLERVPEALQPGYRPGAPNVVRWLARVALISGVALGILGRPPLVWAASFKLVAHPRVSTGSLSAAECSRIFLKRAAKWADGSAVVPVDLPVTARAREHFSQAVHKKSASAVDAYWQKQIFTGRDLPPLTKASEAEVIAFVKATPGALGYVSVDAAAEGVKVIGLD